MSDDLQMIYVRRDGKILGRYFLSYVEFHLGEDNLNAGDWGKIEGMEEWASLGTLAEKMREMVGAKKLSTAKQKKLFKESNLVPWRGIAAVEAEKILLAFKTGSEVPLDHWEKVPEAKTTLGQKAYLEFLGAKEFPDKRKEAESLISTLGGGSEQLVYEASYELLKIRIPEFQTRIRLLKKWMKKYVGTWEEEAVGYELEDLEEELEGIRMTLKDRKEERIEEARFQREERRDFLAALKYEMGSEGIWRESIRPPTLAQVKECVEELEKNDFDWEDDKATLLYLRLIQKYPSLKR